MEVAGAPRSVVVVASPDTADYAWTDLTYLLHRANVSWGYYVVPGSEPDCEDDDAGGVAAPAMAQSGGGGVGDQSDPRPDERRSR